jgi:hypothetical protein
MNMAFLENFKLDGEKEKVHFKSYWVHTILQFVIVAFLIFQENKSMYFGLILLLSNSFFVIAYVSFQFPITGFFTVLAHRLKEKFVKDAGLFAQIFFAIFSFVLMASAFLIILFIPLGFMYVEGFMISEAFLLVLLYFSPVFFVGELFRQRFVLKKIYAPKQ